MRDMLRKAIRIFFALYCWTFLQLSLSGTVFAQSNQQSDFILNIEPATVSATPGQAVNFSIRVNGVTINDVKLSLLSLPPFDIVLGNKIKSASNTIKPLVVKIPLDSQFGSFDIVISGMIEGVSHTATAKLIVVDDTPRIPVVVVGKPFNNFVAVFGTFFSPATRLFINGQDVTDKSEIDDKSILIRGTRQQLGIVKGQNVLELKIDDITTHVLTFRLIKKR
jgi:hypothetical protein